MSNKSTVKIGLAIDAKLYREFVTVAKKNGQSQRYLLQEAIEHYIHNFVPSQHLVRPEVMEAYKNVPMRNSATSTGNWQNKCPTGSI